jgi:hypothetical protein
LVAQADAHGVLPAVLRHFPPFGNDCEFSAAKADAVARHRQSLAMSAMLRQCARDLMAAAAGLPVAVVKGPAFARIIYPNIAMRPYTDIDLLVAPRCVPEVSEILANDGFMRAESDNDEHRREWKWLHRDNAALMVEVQTDLVHTDSLHSALSLTYDDIAGETETAAVQLIVAVVHGGLGAHFDKLRALVDICQAARMVATPNDEARFEALVARTGARLAACTGLGLAGHLFSEPRCLDIARALGPVRYSGIGRMLIDRSVVTSTNTPERWLYSWRRQAFRQLLKQTRRSGGTDANAQRHLRSA